MKKLIIEDINKLIAQQRSIIDLTENILTTLFSICLETRETLTEESKNLEESKKIIEKYKEEIKKLYQELAYFRYNNKEQ